MFNKHSVCHSVLFVGKSLWAYKSERFRIEEADKYNKGFEKYKCNRRKAENG